MRKPSLTQTCHSQQPAISSTRPHHQWASVNALPLSSSQLNPRPCEAGVSQPCRGLTKFPTESMSIKETLFNLPSLDVKTYSAEITRTLHAAAAAAAKSLQSCLALCDPIDGSPPGSPIPGILQARTQEWVAISFSNALK